MLLKPVVDDGDTEAPPIARVKLRKPKQHRMTREHLEQILLKDEVFNKRLSYDEIRQNILLDGEVLTESSLHSLAVAVLERYRIAEVSVDVLHDCVNTAAKRNGFNVVRSYLVSLVSQSDHVGTTAPQLPVSPLLQLPLLFGISQDDPSFSLFGEYCRCFFVGAVARALSPGCKNDTCFVLSGPQGIGKSSFFRIVTEAAGPDLFHDGFCSIGRRDDLMTMNAHWILEWAEIEELIERSASGRVKAFLSAQRDHYRAPYARLPEAHPRHFALAASTNERVFLRDPTGSRRFFVLPCKSIDLPGVVANRDALWQDAYRRYLRGESWWLSDADAAQQASLNEQNQVSDELDVIVSALGERWPSEILKVDSTEARRAFSEVAEEFRVRQDSYLYSRAMDALGFSKRRNTSRRWWER